MGEASPAQVGPRLAPLQGALRGLRGLSHGHRGRIRPHASAGFMHELVRPCAPCGPAQPHPLVGLATCGPLRPRNPPISPLFALSLNMLCAYNGYLTTSMAHRQNVFIVFGILGIVGGVRPKMNAPLRAAIHEFHQHPSAGLCRRAAEPSMPPLSLSRPLAPAAPLAQLKGLRTLAGLGRSAPALRPDTGTGRGRAASDAAEVVDRPLAGWAALKCRLDALLQMLVLVWTHRRVANGTEPRPTTFQPPRACPCACCRLLGLLYSHFRLFPHPFLSKSAGERRPQYIRTPHADTVALIHCHARTSLVAALASTLP